jgi:hypothetical protein
VRTACCAKEFEKTNPIRQPLAGNPKHETRNPEQRGYVAEHDFAKQTQIMSFSVASVLSVAHLKKQSQFAIRLDVSA